MSILVHPLLPLLLLGLATTLLANNVTRFNCGNTLPEKVISVIGLALMCPLGSGGIQRCCGDSDQCYSEDGNGEYCEEVFCGCVTEVVRSTTWCSQEIEDVACSNTQFVKDPSKPAVQVLSLSQLLFTIVVTFVGGYFLGLIIKWLYHNTL